MFPLTPSSSSSSSSFLPSPNTLLTFSESVSTTLPDPAPAVAGGARPLGARTRRVREQRALEAFEIVRIDGGAEIRV